MYYLSFDISKKSAIFNNKFEILLLSVTNTHGVYFVKKSPNIFHVPPFLTILTCFISSNEG